MKRLLMSLPVLALLVTVGCAGGAVYPFTDVNLRRDLDQTTLDRYEREMAACANAGGQSSDHAGRQKMTLESMKKVFLSFANEEKGHRAKLIKIKDGQKLLSAQVKVTDLKSSGGLFVNGLSLRGAI